MSTLALHSQNGNIKLTYLTFLPLASSSKPLLPAIDKFIQSVLVEMTMMIPLFRPLQRGGDSKLFRLT